MPKIKAKVVGKVKRSPVKAGSTPRPHGGFPTQAVIRFNAIVKEKRNGQIPS